MPPSAAATDWSQIVALYDHLHAQRPNPVVAMNRAIAVGELAARPPVSPRSSPSTPNRSPTTSRSTRRAPTCSHVPGATPRRVAAYDRALELTTNPAEHRFLADQRAAAAGA